jgi:hypothetical protein
VRSAPTKRAPKIVHTRNEPRNLSVSVNWTGSARRRLVAAPHCERQPNEQQPAGQTGIALDVLQPDRSQDGGVATSHVMYKCSADSDQATDHGQPRASVPVVYR